MDGTERSGSAPRASIDSRNPLEPVPSRRLSDKSLQSKRSISSQGSGRDSGRHVTPVSALMGGAPEFPFSQLAHAISKLVVQDAAAPQSSPAESGRAARAPFLWERDGSFKPVGGSGTEQSAASDSEPFSEHSDEVRLSARNTSPNTTPDGLRSARAINSPEDGTTTPRPSLKTIWRNHLESESSKSNEDSIKFIPVAPGSSLSPDGGQRAFNTKLFRERIRKRLAMGEERSTKGEVQKDIGWLVSPEELLQLRKTVWIPRGENIPNVSTLDMSYWEACDKGMKGWMGPKLCGEWDVKWGRNKLRFFVMDGTSEESFLTYYTCSDIMVSWGNKSQQKGFIKAQDLRDGYWDYCRKRLKLHRSDRSDKLEILRDIPESLYDALLVCIREMEVSKQAQVLRDERLKEHIGQENYQDFRMDSA
eukprot:GHVN01011452.1.p1 GENE.GHVN01011452.1~~GHVN01011452.1.p1  ORF type:complete len:420 (-),score=32.59 GHVN01011452.1:932-2191(-)